MLLPRLLPRRPPARLPSYLSAFFHASATRSASRKVLQKFKLADIGEGITECEIIKWTVKPLATIQAFDPLCEVQSDKASVEITSPFDGIVKELLVKEGEVAKVGEGLCLIEVDEEILEGAEVDMAVVEPVAVPLQKAEEPPRAVAPERRLHPLDPSYTPPSPPPPPPSSTSGSSLPSSRSRSAQDILAPPSVRHFARQNNVDLAQVAPGSGKGGRVEKRDVEAFLARAAASHTHSGVKPQEQDVVVELGRTRYGMWKAMVKSLDVPHFGYSTTLDITSLHALLPTLNAHIPAHFLPSSTSTSPPPPLLVNPSALYPAPSPPHIPDSGRYTRLTYLPILLKTLSKAMMEWPLFRSSLTPLQVQQPLAGSPPPKPTLTIRPSADITLALSTPTGLYTPTLLSVSSQSIYTLSSRLSHISHLGRQTPSPSPEFFSKEISPKKGGTLTVSNVGSMGKGEWASPVLVEGGGVAIVALGRAKWVWDVDGVRGAGERGGGERRLKLNVSWSADHRVVEGAEMAAFVECWRGYVEAPERLIAEGI